MRHMEKDVERLMRSGFLLMVGLVGSVTLTGCLVAGYSSSGGGFLWPGGFGLVVLLALLFFFLRGRR